MAILGNLIVNLRANAASFITSMERARQRQRQMAQQTQQLSASMKGLGRAALGVVGVAGLGAMVARTVQGADQMQKLSIRLNESVENLSRMQYVANRSGVDFRSFGMSLQRMNRRIAEAATGSGEAKDALKALGLDARQLNAMTPVQQFLALNEAMQQIPREAHQLRIAFKLFDSEGVANLQIMRNGVQEVVRLMAESDALGATLTKRQANTAAAAADEMTKLQSSFQGLLNMALEEFGPGVVKAMDWIRQTAPVVKQAFIDAGELIGRSVGYVATQVERAMQIIDQFRNVQSRLRSAEEIRSQSPVLQATRSIGDAFGETSIGRISRFVNDYVAPQVNPAAFLGQAVGGFAADAVTTVSDPANREIVKLLGRMLESLTTDRTAVAG